MPDLTQSVAMDFIIETVVMIFAVIAIAVIAVKRAKNAKDEE